MEQQQQPESPLFRSFWLGGFEGACQINRAGERLDLIATTQHDRQASDDYRRLQGLDICAARDGIRWHLIERNGRFNFSSLEPMVLAAKEHGVQVIWNICHYGWPDDVDIWSPDFISRFARFCGVVAEFMARQSDDVPFYTPINEISFLAWAAGDVGYIYPYGQGRGNELKQQLVRAAIAGIGAIWAVDPRARIAHVDPVIHVVAPRDRPDLAEASVLQRAGQFEAWDMLSGRLYPELGGQPRYLDIVGVNYYHANQWQYPDIRMAWEAQPRDERWMPLHKLLAEVHRRYQRPMFMAETSHFGVGRGPWLREIANEVARARRIGVPLEGICLYPIIDRPDWDDASHWHNSGLWDLMPDRRGQLLRKLDPVYAYELRQAQELLATAREYGV